MTGRLSDSQHDIDTKNQEANAKDHTELPDAKKTFFKYMDHGIVMLYNDGYMHRKRKEREREREEYNACNQNNMYSKTQCKDDKDRE